jgi:hypothetical protein
MAERVYYDLAGAGHKPWLDKYDLKPGANWRASIAHEIGRCHFFLALLTAHSLSKRGYVQMELRTALEILQLYPSHKRFLIPIRLEECYPSDDKLAALHWVDLFPKYEEGFVKLVRFLGRRSRPRPTFRSFAEHGIDIPSGIHLWSDQRVKDWVERELWPMLIDRARRAYEYIEVPDYMSTVLQYAQQLLAATAREHGFLEAYERGIRGHTVKSA